jgi:hypothetical protein
MEALFPARQGRAAPAPAQKEKNTTRVREGIKSALTWGFDNAANRVKIPQMRRRRLNWRLPEGKKQVKNGLFFADIL